MSIRALSLTRVGASSRTPTHTPQTAGIFDGWWPSSEDPWKNLPDPWGAGGALATRKMQVHESLTRSRDRVYRAQGSLPQGDVAKFEELYQGWMAFAWQHAPTDQAPQLLEAYGKKADDWRHYLDQRELDKGSAGTPVLPILGGVALLGAIVYGVVKST